MNRITALRAQQRQRRQQWQEEEHYPLDMVVARTPPPIYEPDYENDARLHLMREMLEYERAKFQAQQQMLMQYQHRTTQPTQQPTPQQIIVQCDSGGMTFAWGIAIGLAIFGLMFLFIGFFSIR